MKYISFIAKGISLFFLLFALCLQVKGQVNQGITNIQPIPDNPHSGEVLQFEVESIFWQQPCDISNYQVEISGFTVWVGICYDVGDATAPCNPIDTIILGQLPAGDFEFVFQSFKNTLDGACYELISTDTIQLTISLTSSTFMPIEEVGISISPNPFTNQFAIQVESDAQNHPVSLRLYDYSGREVYFRTLDRNIAHHIKTSHLPPGVYLYRMELENGQEVSGKVVKH